MRIIRPIGASALAALVPSRCICCRAPLGAEDRSGPLCPRCGCEVGLAAPVRLRADGIDGGLAALPYRGAGRRLVAALKFSCLRPAAELGAELIAARAPASLLDGPLVPVPSMPLRRARRGIDPPLELARALAPRCGMPVLPMLRRRDLGHQRGRRRAERLARPPSMVAAGPAPERAVLLDDVVTTGATVDACARALREAGARRVAVVAIAAVPQQRRRLPSKPRRT
jgi:predicted amidophosphoribosyltransferase